MRKAPCIFVSAKAKPLSGRGDWICKDERSEDGIAIAVRECRDMKISRHDRVTISNRTSHLDRKGEQTARQIKKQGALAPCLFVSAKAKPLTGRGDWICKDERSEDGIGEHSEPSQFQTGQVSLTEGTSERQKANKKARRNCLVCLPSPRAKSLTGRGDWI